MSIQQIKDMLAKNKTRSQAEAGRMALPVGMKERREKSKKNSFKEFNFNLLKTKDKRQKKTNAVMLIVMVKKKGGLRLTFKVKKGVARDLWISPLPCMGTPSMDLCTYSSILLHVDVGENSRIR